MGKVIRWVGAAVLATVAVVATAGAAIPGVAGAIGLVGVSSAAFGLAAILTLRNCADSSSPNARKAASRSRSQPAQAIAAVLSEPTPAARKKVIHRQLAAIWPTPLTDDELEWAAQFVEENRSKGAAWIAGRLLRMQRETKICRGI